MAEKHSALIIATSAYEDPVLRRLAAPAQDAEALAGVLGDAAIGGFEVRTLVDQPSYKVSEEVEATVARPSLRLSLRLRHQGRRSPCRSRRRSV